MRALVLLALALALYVLRLDDVAGVIRDDAWYLVLAKAIAEGSGPTLISAAGGPFLSSVYPPGFPALLSLVFLIRPDFPGNLMWLKGVSIAAMLGAGVLMFLYASRERGFSGSAAVLLAAAVVVTPAFVFLSTSTLMSEPVFLCLQLLAVIAIERAVRATDDRNGRLLAVGAAGLAGLAFLTRTAGLTLGAAGVLYLLYQRRWRQAGIFAVVLVLCVAPWSLYSRMHGPSQQQLDEQGGNMAIRYADQFWTSEAGNITAEPIGVGGLPARIWRNVVNITIRDIGGIFVPVAFRSASESGTETFALGPPKGMLRPSMGGDIQTQLISLSLSALIAIGFVVTCRRRLSVAEPLVVLTLGMIVLWPFWTFRFVLPLVPFLLVYLVTGIETLAGGTGRAVRIFLMVSVGLNVLDHTQYIAQAYVSPRSVVWTAQMDDINQVFDWLRRHPTSGAVATDNPALVYLHTGRKTVSIDGVGDPWERWQRAGVRYVAAISDTAMLEDPRAVLRYKHPHRMIWVFEVSPD